MSMAVAEEKETQTKLNQLDQLKKFTKVVADTADFESIKEFKPQDATTNPSLVYAATQKQQYAHLIEEVLADRKKSELSGHEQIEDICDHLLVQFGCDILEIVPGRVSTETDARLSYDVEGSINKARTLIKLYEERKIPRERVLIKIASTWEGLLAAEQLQKEGAVDLSVRRSDLRLVQKGEQTRLHRPGRSGSAIGHGDLHLLQKIRHPDRSHGREFPQYWPDSGIGRL